MDPNNQMAGTQGQPAAPGDAAAAVTDRAAQAPDGGDAGGDRTDYKALYLEAKTKVEQFNSVERRAQELEQRLANQPPTAGNQNELPNLQRLHMEAEQRLMAAATGSEPDPVAVYILSLRQETIGLRAENALLHLPASDRDEARAAMIKYGVADPQMAMEIVRGKRAPTLEQENASLKAEIERMRKQPDPPNTTVPGASPAGGVNKPTGGVERITQAEYLDRASKDPKKTHSDWKAGRFVVA